MLRQIHIFFKTEHVFIKDYAVALGKEELNNILGIIGKYMEMPIPGKTFRHHIENYQIFHGAANDLYFLFVGDLVDSLQNFEKLIEKTIKKFQELFPDPNDVKESSRSKEDFLNFLDQLQVELHSKIAIIGPTYSGKSTLYNILKSEEERKMLDFARASKMIIDGLSFDLWDFVLKDNISLLWPKFISGSDLVILLFNLADYNLKIIDHFMNLQKLEGNYSKLLIIGNKRDLVEDDDIKRIKNELNIDGFKEISLNSPDAKSTILQYIREMVGLKRKLPQNFEELVREADDLVAEGKNVQALAKYKELITICNTYQDFEHLNVFQEKISKLEGKIKEQLEVRKKIELTKEFAIPAHLKFRRKISVKPLPTAKPLDQPPDQIEDKEKVPTPPSKSPSKLISFQKLETKPKELKISKITELPPKPLKLTKPSPKSEKEKVESKMAMELFPPHDDLIKVIDKPKVIEFTKELQKLIMEQGSSLSLQLCEKLVTELEESLERPLTLTDIKLAANFFVKQE